MPLDDLGPEILWILFLRWECKLALDTLICLGLLEFDDQLARRKPFPPIVPLALILIFQLLKLLQRLHIDQLSEGSLLHHFHGSQLLLVQQILPVLSQLGAFFTYGLSSLHQLVETWIGQGPAQSC